MSKETKATLVAFIIMGILMGAFAAGLVFMAKAVGSFIEQNYNPRTDCIRVFDPSVCD